MTNRYALPSHFIDEVSVENTCFCSFSLDLQKNGMQAFIFIVQEYYSRLKALRWQAISVRAEEQGATGLSSPSEWHFQGKFQELGEGDMDVLSAECKSAGLSHLFKAALKLA